jgi:glycosyltransferase involved in cell wall biosynthesis
VDDKEMRTQLAHCQALIFPGEEDFGIVPVEAQAAGRPVLAYAGGGALDTVVEGVTGLFFREPTVASLADTLSRFDAHAFVPRQIAAHAARFDVEEFKRRIRLLVNRTALPDQASGETSPHLVSW